MQLNPLRDLLLIELDEKSNKQGVFYVADAWGDESRIGTVKKVGPDVKDFKEGDRVYTNPYATMEINTGNKEDKNFKLIKESDIMATL